MHRDCVHSSHGGVKPPPYGRPRSCWWFCSSDPTLMDRRRWHCSGSTPRLKHNEKLRCGNAEASWGRDASESSREGWPLSSALKIRGNQWRQPVAPRLRREAPSEPDLRRVGGRPPKCFQLQLSSLRGDSNAARGCLAFRCARGPHRQRMKVNQSQEKTARARHEARELGAGIFDGGESRVRAETWRWSSASLRAEWSLALLPREHGRWRAHGIAPTSSVPRSRDVATKSSRGPGKRFPGLPAVRKQLGEDHHGTARDVPGTMWSREVDRR